MYGSARRCALNESYCLTRRARADRNCKLGKRSQLMQASFQVCSLPSKDEGVRVLRRGDTRRLSVVLTVLADRAEVRQANMRAPATCGAPSQKTQACRANLSAQQLDQRLALRHIEPASVNNLPERAELKLLRWTERRALTVSQSRTRSGALKLHGRASSKPSSR